MIHDSSYETCDSSKISSQDLSSLLSAKTSPDRHVNDSPQQEPLFIPLNFIKLFTTLKRQIQKHLNLSFSLIFTQASLNKFLTQSAKQQKKLQPPTLYQKRLIIQNVLKQMLRTGYVKLIQRPFWIWKFSLPLKKTLKPVSQTRNRKVFCRILINRLTRHSFHKKNSFFVLRSHSQPHSPKLPKKNNFRKLFPLLTLLNQRLTQILFQIKTSPLLKLKLLALSTIFEQRIKKIWHVWRWDSTSELVEEFNSTLNTVKTEVKNYYLIKKPCVPIYFYDIHTYDPAFQATFHCLNHFLKRRIRIFLRKWAGCSYRCPSITSLCSNSPADTSIDYSLYKLDKESEVKLQKVLTELVLVNQRRLELPKRVLCRWSEECNIQNLKINKLKLMILGNQKKNEKKRLAFSRISRYVKGEIEFTDRM